jgi:hypothetical protein
MDAAADRKLAQAVVVDRDLERVLLALHKEGRYEGFYTGLLDEILDNEMPAVAAARIAWEQAEIRLGRSEFRALFTFTSALWGRTDEYEFLVEAFYGQPRETRKMRPEWYPIDRLPYQRMPADDALWYPLLLAGKRLQGRFDFAPDGVELLSHEIIEVVEVQG